MQVQSKNKVSDIVLGKNSTISIKTEQNGTLKKCFKAKLTKKEMRKVLDLINENLGA